MKKETQEKLHSQGQADGAKGPSHYAPPHGVLRATFHDGLKAENDAYIGGYLNAKSQRDK